MVNLNRYCRRCGTPQEGPAGQLCRAKGCGKDLPARQRKKATLGALLPAPHLIHHWDLIIVNSSAGKDSQAMLHTIAEQARLLGVRDRIRIAHADLGRVEWEGTKELVYTQARAYGLEDQVQTIARPQGDLVQQIKDRRAKLDSKGQTDAPAWPDSQTRFCTSDQKRGQVAKLITAWVDEWRAANPDADRPCRVLNLLGFRAQESSARAKRPLFSENRKTSGKAQVWDHLPIHEWTEQEVWDTIHFSGVPWHPAYDLGMPRLSCVFCVFAPKKALMIAAKANPDLFQEYLDLETEVRSTFRNGFSLQEVRDALDEGEDTTISAAEAADWNL